ncbi:MULTISPECIES: beta-carotene 15,15'-monooxygenase [Lactobacillus]|uniref:beta-carotene 15,15'-monooxygenase n=1 Tax=Lactobacillus TaxID=1578 RepID=UPI0019160497|nr:beta-carotene 15,15'-monooxygenase [Lactobacillus nasalidis]
MYIIRQQWLQDNAIRKWYFLAAILILFGGCSNAIGVRNAPQSQWLELTIFSRFLVFSLLVPAQMLLLLCAFRIRLQDIYVTGSRRIIWKQLEYHLAMALLVTLVPWGVGCLMGMCLNGWGPTLEAIAGEILIRYLYLALSCLATLLITSFFLLVSNQTWAFLSGFILNGISFGLNVNRHLSLFYDFLIPNTYFLLLVMFPMLLVLILILVFIVRLEIFRKDW